MLCTVFVSQDLFVIHLATKVYHSGLHVAFQLPIFTLRGLFVFQPVEIIAIGEGPVVYITPDKLDWGHTKVLTPVLKTVQLSNESDIPAIFIAQMVRCSLYSLHAKVVEN